jgi:hypothetical protein
MFTPSTLTTTLGLALLVSAPNLHGRPFEIIALSDPTITTHELTSGDFTLGVTDYGGGSINKMVIPGVGDISTREADRYGRMGQMAVRDSLHGGRYNPTQAGFYEYLGTQCEITTNPGKLTLEPRGIALWHGDGQYDFTEWENIGRDPYDNDGGNSDIDGLDESNLEVVINGRTFTKQEAEVYSEYDFYGSYEDYKGRLGIETSAIRHYAEFRFIREPGHCVYQHREGTKLYNPALIQGDISVEQPRGTHRGTEGELSNPIKAWNLRFDNAEWDPNYRFVNRGSSQWVAEFRRTGIYRVDNPFRMAIIVAESNDPDTGRAMGIYYPKSEINNYPIIGVVEATGEIAYKDPRTNLLKAVEDRTVVRGAMTKIGFTTRIRGMISRDRLPQGVYETWREEYFIFYGTPRQIMDAIEAYEADKQHQVITFPLLQQVSPGSGQLTLAATASSGLPVTYTSSNPEVAIVTGNRIQIVGSGETTITASQYGNRDTAMAPDVSRALVVSDGPDWAGFPVVAGQFVDTAGWLGWLNILAAPYIYSESLSQWLYLEEAQVNEAGTWAYFFNY